MFTGKIIPSAGDIGRRFNRMAAAIVRGADKGLGRWVIMAHRKALELLSGSFDSPSDSFPVASITGNLRRLEGYVLPGRSKSGVSAKSGQAYVINTAIYANVIHEKRPYATTGVEETRKDGMAAISHDAGLAMMAVR